MHFSLFVIGILATLSLVLAAPLVVDDTITSSIGGKATVPTALVSAVSTPAASAFASAGLNGTVSTSTMKVPTATATAVASKPTASVVAASATASARVNGTVSTATMMVPTATAVASKPAASLSAVGPKPTASAQKGSPSSAHGPWSSRPTGAVSSRPSAGFGMPAHGKGNGNGSHPHAGAGKGAGKGAGRHGFGPQGHRNATAVPLAAAGNSSGLHARAGGASAIVVNSCPFVVYTNIVHSPRAGTGGAPEEVPITLQPGGSASHPFSHDLNMGVSWKIWRTDNGNNGVVQFEYTPEAAVTWYDLSMINGGTIVYTDPSLSDVEIEDGANNDGSGALTGQVGVVHAFAAEGLSLTAQGSGGGGCGSITCPAGESTCSQAYNTDDDHQAMRSCGASVDLKLTLCG